MPGIAASLFDTILDPYGLTAAEWERFWGVSLMIAAYCAAHICIAVILAKFGGGGARHLRLFVGLALYAFITMLLMAATILESALVCVPILWFLLMWRLRRHPDVSYGVRLGFTFVVTILALAESILLFGRYGSLPPM